MSENGKLVTKFNATVEFKVALLAARGVVCEIPAIEKRLVGTRRANRSPSYFPEYLNKILRIVSESFLKISTQPPKENHPDLHRLNVTVMYFGEDDGQKLDEQFRVTVRYYPQSGLRSNANQARLEFSIIPYFTYTMEPDPDLTIEEVKRRLLIADCVTDDPGIDLVMDWIEQAKEMDKVTPVRYYFVPETGACNNCTAVNMFFDISNQHRVHIHGGFPLEGKKFPKEW